MLPEMIEGRLMLPGIHGTAHAAGEVLAGSGQRGLRLVPPKSSLRGQTRNSVYGVTWRALCKFKFLAGPRTPNEPWTLGLRMSRGAKEQEVY